MRETNCVDSTTPEEREAQSKIKCTTTFTTAGTFREIEILANAGMTPEQRKAIPVYSGVLKYFPDALLEVTKASLVGNKQHLNGQELHWDRSKSTDQMEALTRHLLDHARGEVFDSDGVRHLSKLCWRALAQLQIDVENEKTN